MPHACLVNFFARAFSSEFNGHLPNAGCVFRDAPHPVFELLIIATALEV